MNIEFASISDTGRVRQNNEDACGGFVPEDEAERERLGALFVVADGMGGHRGGEIASRLAVQTIHNTYFDVADDDRRAALLEAFAKANAAILAESVADAALFGMGTTCTALAVHDGRAYLTHIGDTRAYLFRDGEITQLTHDHSLVGEMVRSGMITDEDARTHPRRNVITRSLGIQESVVADAPESPVPVREGDTFLLCSDGLTTVVSDADIAFALEADAPAEVCRQLVDAANARGGRDNITVVVVAVRAL
jgi:protein phosphatase